MADYEQSNQVAPVWFTYWVDNDFRPWKASVNRKLQEQHDDIATRATADDLERVERKATGAARDAQEASGSAEAHLAALVTVKDALRDAQVKLEAIDKRGARRTRRDKWLAPLVPAVLLLLNALTQRFILPPGAPNSPTAVLPGPTPTVVAISPDGGVP